MTNQPPVPHPDHPVEARPPHAIARQVERLGLTRLIGLGGGAVRANAIAIARAKADLGVPEALARGILCNALVCMAVWLTQGGRTVTDRILGILFPITAFVAMGLEHSIANWFFLPYGVVLDGAGAVSLAGAARNLLAVTAGNLAGGTLLVAGVYWVAYLRRGRVTPS